MDTKYPISFMTNQRLSSLDACLILEGEYPDATDDDCINSLQLLIDTGIVWNLQGTYGRMAASAIDSGICHQAGEV